MDECRHSNREKNALMEWLHVYYNKNNVVMQWIIQMFGYKNTESWTLSYVLTAALLVRV